MDFRAQRKLRASGQRTFIRSAASKHGRDFKSLIYLRRVKGDGRRAARVFVCSTSRGLPFHSRGALGRRLFLSTVQ